MFLVSKRNNKNFFDAFGYKEDFQHSILAEKNYSKGNIAREYPFIETL